MLIKVMLLFVSDLCIVAVVKYLHNLIKCFNDALNTFYLQFYGNEHICTEPLRQRERIPTAATSWATLSN